MVTDRVKKKTNLMNNQRLFLSDLAIEKILN